jgi:hypothetical protein
MVELYRTIAESYCPVAKELCHGLAQVVIVGPFVETTP